MFPRGIWTASLRGDPRFTLENKADGVGRSTQGTFELTSAAKPTWGLPRGACPWRVCSANQHVVIVTIADPDPDDEVGEFPAELILHRSRQVEVDGHGRILVGADAPPTPSEPSWSPSGTAWSLLSGPGGRGNGAGIGSVRRPCSLGPADTESLLLREGVDLDSDSITISKAGHLRPELKQRSRPGFAVGHPLMVISGVSSATGDARPASVSVCTTGPMPL